MLGGVGLGEYGSGGGGGDSGNGRLRGQTLNPHVSLTVLVR